MLHGLLAGCVIWGVASLGVLYIWHEARVAQIDAVRTSSRNLREWLRDKWMATCIAR